MGAMGAWNEDGNKMCFNAAKTWYNGWFRDHHETVIPSTSRVELELVGVDDAVHSLISNNQKVVVKIKGHGNSDHLFIMFNRKKGINEGVAGYGDKLLITKQGRDGEVSRQQASLSPGQYYDVLNWKDGRDLVVQAHNTVNSINGDYMRVSTFSGIARVGRSQRSP